MCSLCIAYIVTCAIVVTLIVLYMYCIALDGVFVDAWGFDSKLPVVFLPSGNCISQPGIDTLLSAPSR